MPKVNRSRIGLTVVLWAALTGSGQAGLTGASVNVSPFYPDTNSMYEASPNTIVSGAIEYPAGSFPTYSVVWQIDISDTQLTISNTSNASNTYQSVSFNGWNLTINSGPSISSAVSDGTSQFNPVGISIVNGNELFLNYSGVGAPPLGTSIIDITTVPEPATWAMLAMGIGTVLGGLRLRRRS